MARKFLALVKSIEREGEYPLTKEAIAERDLADPFYQAAEADLKSLKARLTAINPVVDEAETPGAAQPQCRRPAAGTGLACRKLCCLSPEDH